ncbi:MAG TPA: MOSC domain-containing protein [Steroidobacteraceae bacterium]|nr:MOSC domain-containing protein [Steroidobacteraceae bacterium]
MPRPDSTGGNLPTPLSVQIGAVAPLAIGDEHVISGIRMHAIAGPVAVNPLGLAGDELPPGSLGENLTIQGLLETALFVGDCLRFPGCELRVTQPRGPCYKFAAVMGDKLAPRKMVQTGFFGFHLAVDQPGSIEAGQAFELVKGPRTTPLTALFPSGRR